MIPPVLTCIVGKQLCENPNQNHWQLREFSANIIASLCQSYGGMYHTLQPRITKTLLKTFLDREKSLGTQYGALIALSYLGYHVIDLLVFPNLEAYGSYLERELSSGSELDQVRHLELRKCIDALAVTFIL